MCDHIEAYSNAIGIWNNRIKQQSKNEMNIDNIQKMLYEIQGLQRNVDWLSEYLVEKLRDTGDA